jgi:4-amino-4-deoxy-L-arabinose transferase-like glycosyltransferase
MGTEASLAGVRRSEGRTLRGRLSSWWSHVLFPGEPVPPRPGRAVLACELLLVLGAGLLFSSRLDCPLQEPEESLYAEIPRQMLAEGRVLVPVRHGQDYYDKPPLLYWLVMGAYRLFGIHAWSARLLPALSAFLCVLVTYWWGKRAVGPRAAFAGAVMLCLSWRYAQMARMLTMNGLLTLWVTAALATAHLALAGPAVRRGWWLLSAFLCALGCLTKGPVALLLVAGPMLLYQLLDRRSARAGVRLWLLYVAGAASLALPWFVALAARDPSFLHYFVWIHHVRRFADPIDHLQPVWYYVPGLLLGMMPWTLLLPWLVMLLAGRAPEVKPQRTGALGVFLLAALWGLLFFSASACKRPSYILPVLPPLALALGCSVDAAGRLGRLRLAHWASAAAATFLVLFLAAQYFLPAYADKYSLYTPIAPHAGEGTLPVLCYPHGWDGVSFYLQRGDVRVFRVAQLGDMVSALRQRPQSLVVVKADASLDRFLEALPESLEFVQCARQEPVAVGWVRSK